MLTQSEREWLEERESILEKYGCYSLKFYRMREDDFGYIGDIFDALEFSERVAAKLADSISNELNFVSGKNVVQEAVEYRGKRHTIAWARLKLARLKVEEEMDGLSI